MKLDTPRRAVTLAEVRARREEIVQLDERFGVRIIRVFGSVARGEATPESDLDLLVDVDRVTWRGSPWVSRTSLESSPRWPLPEA